MTRIMMSPELAVCFWLIALYGMSEVLFMVVNKTYKTKKKFDFTLYLITIPFMLTLLLSLFERLFHPMRIPAWIVIPGGGILLAGIFLRIWALVILGKGFSMKAEKKDDQKLVTSGPYILIRHPLYLGSLLICIGTVTMNLSIWGAIAFVPGVAGIILRIIKEEKLLETELPGYSEYKARTYRLIPGIF